MQAMYCYINIIYHFRHLYYACMRCRVKKILEILGIYLILSVYDKIVQNETRRNYAERYLTT